MRADLSVHMDNAAFEDNPNELARILRELADKIEKDGGVTPSFTGLVARDVNGNKVGTLRIITL